MAGVGKNENKITAQRVKEKVETWSLVSVYFVSVDKSTSTYLQLQDCQWLYLDFGCYLNKHNAFFLKQLYFSDISVGFPNILGNLVRTYASLLVSA